MKLREDFTLSIRALLTSPLESLLLVVGLALSIGATASGLGMLASANAEGEALLQQPEYREIVVTSRATGNELDEPVVESSEETVTLSVDDLTASEVSPAISYAYLATQTRLRLNTGAFGNFGPPDRNEDDSAEGTRVEAPAGSEDENSNSETRPPIEFAEVEGIQPVLNELSGYQVTPEFFDAMNLNVEAGSTFTEQDMATNAKVLVLGYDIANTLFEDGESLGRQIASFDSIYTIIGVLDDTDSALDNYAYQPSALASNTTGARAFGGPQGRFSSSLHFAVEDADQLDAAANQLQSWFNSQYGEEALSISVPLEEAERAIDRTENMAVITLVLALAGLLIASVNVSNILYGRALRRRKQIGILKALGASRQHIFNLFFSEGGLILSLGAILGIGVVALFSLLLIQSGETELSVLAVVVGILLSSIITLLFTLVPALQATHVEPAEAMRTE